MHCHTRTVADVPPPDAPAPALGRAPGVVASVLGTDVLLLPPGADAVLRLNSSGAAVWELLEQPQTPEQLVAALAAAFDAPPARVREDIAPLLAQLTAAGALVPAAP